MRLSNYIKYIWVLQFLRAELQISSPDLVFAHPWICSLTYWLDLDLRLNYIVGMCLDCLKHFCRFNFLRIWFFLFFFFKVILFFLRLFRCWCCEWILWWRRLLVVLLIEHRLLSVHEVVLSATEASLRRHPVHGGILRRLHSVHSLIGIVSHHIGNTTHLLW